MSSEPEAEVCDARAAEQGDTAGYQKLNYNYEKAFFTNWFIIIFSFL